MLTDVGDTAGMSPPPQQADIRTEVEAELIHTAHTNVLLLRQLFLQAEKWHLKLNADLSELENRELLEQIREFEERQFAGASRDADFKPKLTPINEGGGAALLKIEIQRLEEDKDALEQRLKQVGHCRAPLNAGQQTNAPFRSLPQVEAQALALGRDKTRLATELDRALGAGSAQQITGSSGEDLAAMERQLSRLDKDLASARLQGDRRAEEATGEVAAAKQELLRVRSMLEMAEKELEAKVSQTTPFKNLKAMLQKKNEQMKELRRRLNRYEED